MNDNKSKPGAWVRELLCYPDSVLRRLGITREELKRAERVLNSIEVVELPNDQPAQDSPR